MTNNATTEQQKAEARARIAALKERNKKRRTVKQFLKENNITLSDPTFTTLINMMEAQHNLMCNIQEKLQIQGLDKERNSPANLVQQAINEPQALTEKYPELKNQKKMNDFAFELLPEACKGNSSRPFQHQYICMKSNMDHSRKDKLQIKRLAHVFNDLRKRLYG